jgi:hypothetical protein
VTDRDSSSLCKVRRVRAANGAEKRCLRFAALALYVLLGRTLEQARCQPIYVRRVVARIGRQDLDDRADSALVIYRIALNPASKIGGVDRRRARTSKSLTCGSAGSDPTKPSSDSFFRCSTRMREADFGCRREARPPGRTPSARYRFAREAVVSRAYSTRHPALWATPGQ